MKRSRAIAVAVAVVVLVGFVGIAARGLLSRPESGTDAPTGGEVGAGGGSGEPGLHAAPPALRAQADKPGTNGVRKAPLAFRGRVVDDHRRPVADATVTVRFPGVPSVTTRSGSDGEFGLETDLHWAGGWVSGGVFVRDPAGRTALAGVRFHFQGSGPMNLGTLEVAAARALDVRVEDSGRLAPGATVRVSAIVASVLIPVGDGTTDARGRVTIASCPSGDLRVVAIGPEGRHAHLETRAPSADESPLVLSLAPPRILRVRVLDDDTGDSVAGARVSARPSLTVEDDAAVLVAAPTDAGGWTVIEGAFGDETLYLDASAEGYGSDGIVAMNEVGPRETGFVLRLERLRTRTFPVKVGERPVPPDGTVLALRPASWVSAGTVARVRGSVVEVEGLDSGFVERLAVAPDGSVAVLRADVDEAVGTETTFRRPRRVEVHVTEESGAAIAGVAVRADDTDGTPWGEVTSTGPDGVAVIDGLPARDMEVYVGMTPEDGWGSKAAVVDLAMADGRVNVTFGSVRDAVVRVRVDGKPCIPSGFTWSVSKTVFAEGSEEPETGTLRVRLRPRSVHATPIVWIEAPGFNPAGAMLQWERRGSPAVADIGLTRSGTLVTRIAARPGVAVRVKVEHVRGSDEWPLPDGPAYDSAGVHRWEEVRPANYRVRDLDSGLFTGPIAVRSGETTEAFLDLTGFVVVRGRVVLPEGWEVNGVEVACEGRDIDTTSGSQSGKAIEPDGSFVLAVPGDRPVTLRVRHPTLLSSDVASSATVTAPTDEVILRLEEPSTAFFRWVARDAGPAEPDRARGHAYLLKRESEDSPSGSHRVTILKDGKARFSEFEPGKYVVWIDLEPFAPTRIGEVTLGPKRTDLGTVVFEKGSAVRARVLVAEGKDEPDVEGYAQRLEGVPDYERWLKWSGDGHAFLGLGPGKFRLEVEWKRPDGVWKKVEQTIEVDGHTDRTIEVDTR